MFISKSEYRVLDFHQPIPQHILNIDEKNRSNLLAWRGQFSPQLIESLLQAYCIPDTVVLDPFSGSVTTLYEAGRFGLAAYGFEINPAAWILSKTYQWMNIDIEARRVYIDAVKRKVARFCPEVDELFVKNRSVKEKELMDALLVQVELCAVWERHFIESMIILMDLFNNYLTSSLICDCFFRLEQLIMTLPFSEVPITAKMADARQMPLQNQSVDFVVTSPPYINVFNYHQNYRRSAEALGWDLLKIARSEIGANRANRANRFITVIQYCLDMTMVLQEIHRVCKPGARIILIMGHESNVLGVPFYNAEIVERLSVQTGLFVCVQKQYREFRNKFGKMIREDVIHLMPLESSASDIIMNQNARNIASEALNRGIDCVSSLNKKYLMEAMKRVDVTQSTPVMEMSVE